MYMYCCSPCKAFYKLPEKENDEVCTKCGKQLVPLKIIDDKWDNMSDNEKRNIIMISIRNSEKNPNNDKEKFSNENSENKRLDLRKKDDQTETMYMYCCPPCKVICKDVENNSGKMCSKCGKALIPMNVTDIIWDSMSRDEKQKTVGVVMKSSGKPDSLPKMDTESNDKNPTSKQPINNPSGSQIQKELNERVEYSQIEKKHSFFDEVPNQEVLVPTDKSMECPKCGNKISTNSKFCSECGYSFVSTEEKIDLTKKKSILKKGKNEEDKEKNNKKWLMPIVIGSVAVVLVIAVIISVSLVSKANKPAKEAMRLIDAIGEVTKESEEAIIEAEDYYAVLTDRQKDSVENYKILVDARERYEEICAEEETEARIKELDEKISRIAKAKVKKQSDIDEIMDMYNKIPDDKKSMVSADIKSIDELTEYEKIGVAATKALKSSLKDSGSLVVHSISVGKGTSKAVSPFYAHIDYSAKNSFGGTIDEIATIDVTSKMEAGWWKMAQAFGDNGYTALQVYKDYLSNCTDKMDLDPDRIMKNL